MENDKTFQEGKLIMEDVWEILQLEETDDRNTIKKAYAEQAKKYNPEDSPEEFLRLRRAYEKALILAENLEKGVQNSSQPVGSQGIENAGTEAGTRAETSSQPGFHWNFEQENPFRGGEGIRRFLELYTGKRRKDPVAWTDFFLSEAFLEGYQEKDFVELMYEAVSDNAEEFPPGKEFLTALYIAYGLRAYKTQEGMELEMDGNAPFSGIAYIGKIAGMGAAITRFKGNEPAMIAAYRDYRNLLGLARKDIWDDEALLALGKVIDHYGLADISDSPIPNADQYELSQRHPKSLKLITYFFVNTKAAIGQQENASGRLPAKVYRLVWSRLGLEHATNGREKLLYGGLRDAVLAHVPDIMDKPKVDYKKLTHDFFYDYHGGALDCYKNEGRTPEEREVLDRFLEREDVRFALLDESYVDKQISRYWVTANSGIYLLDRLEEFYKSHLDAPFASHMIDRIAEMRERGRVNRELKEDQQSMPVQGSFDFQNRAFLRYYLHAAFHLARGFRNDVLLAEYLQERMPYSAEWSKLFAEIWEKGDSARPIEIRFGEVGEDVLSIIFHPRYIEYLWNGSHLVPHFPGQALAEIDRDDYFWLLVPVAAASYEESSNLYGEMVNRLKRLPLQQEDIPVIADCIVGSICHFDGEQMPVCRFYSQKGEQLFGCDVYEDGRVVLFEELSNVRHRVADDSDAPDVESGVRMGWRMLQELSAEWDGEVHLDVLPEWVLAAPRWGTPKTLAGEEVSEATIQGLLGEYFLGKLRRLELDFGGRALVFLKNYDRKQYACFYFEHQKQCWYRLVGMPEVYGIVDEKDVVYEPFGLGMLPNYVIHRGLGYMESLLEDVFAQVACKDPNPAFMTWSFCGYFTAQSQQYHLAQRLFGGYPPEQACNRMQEQFYIPEVPSYLSYIDLEGNGTEEVEVSRDKDMVQAMLARYMAGKLCKLVLDWKYRSGENPQDNVLSRRIVLLQEKGSHMMIYKDDARGGKDIFVADVKEYMDAKGKKYRKEAFLGEKVPGYLVHTDLRRIRDCLDILIPQIMDPYAVLNQFGEFAYQEQSS